MTIEDTMQLIAVLKHIAGSLWWLCILMAVLIGVQFAAAVGRK